MPDLLRLALVSAVAAASTAVSTEAVVRITQPRSAELRAARVDASLRPAEPSDTASAGAVPKARDGHYWADGEVDGRPVRFLVDTGATAVALTPGDAERLGIRLDDLDYAYKVVTAAGLARAAAVKLGSVTVAGARLDNVDAYVIERGLDASLLGMSYLGRLSSFQATREALFLRP